MKTFKLDIATTATVTVPDVFLQQLREMATGDDPGPFLTEMQKQHADDDDSFLLAVLGNGIRIEVRETLIRLLHGSGLGVRLAPAQVKGEPKLPPPEDAVPVLLADATKNEVPVALELPE